MKAHSRKERQKCNNFEWMLRKCALKAWVLPLWKSNRPQGSLPTLDTTSLWSGVTCPLRMFVLLWKAQLYREDAQQMGRGGAEAGGQRVTSLVFKSLVILLKKKKKASKPPNISANVTKVTFSDRFSFFFFFCMPVLVVWWLQQFVSFDDFGLIP